MSRTILYLILFLFSGNLFCQNTNLISAGDQAPPFVLNLDGNSIQGISMPHQNKIVLLHYWSTNQASSKKNNKFLNQLAERYKESEYINAEGFEIISVAVQTDKTAWKEAITKDSLKNFVHGIALKGFTEDVCLKYGVTNIPTDILVDETGKIIAINPKIIDIENILDNKKNVHPLKKDIYGFLAQSSNKEDQVKYSKIYLFNHYGDSLAFTRTDDKGEFSFHDIKLNQDFILKLDNQMDIVTSDPIALYSVKGELILDGKTNSGGFVFYIPSRISSRLTIDDTSHTNNHSTIEISVIKNLDFKNGGANISTKDEQELNTILQLLAKNKNAFIEFTTHTDTKLDSVSAKKLTDQQALTIKTYFLKKGIQLFRIRAFSKGNSALRHTCLVPSACSEEEHKQNRRVEFSILKN